MKWFEVVHTESHAEEEEEDGQKGEGRMVRCGKGGEREVRGRGRRKGREAHRKSRPHQVAVEAAVLVSCTWGSRSSVAPCWELTCFGEPRSYAVEEAVEWVNGKPNGKREKEWNTESDRSERAQNG